MKNEEKFRILIAFYERLKKKDCIKKCDEYRFASSDRQNAPIRHERVTIAKSFCSKNKYNSCLLRVLSFALAFFVLLPEALSIPPTEDIDYVPSAEASTVGASIQKQLSDAIENFLCVVKSYPVRFENIGVVESDVITFKNHMVRFIYNRLRITSDNVVKSMVRGSENLYRFLTDRKNHLNLKQQRTINNISEQEMSCLKSINNVLIECFNTYKTVDLPDYIHDDMPELMVISATLYCFASDSDLENMDSFVRHIFLKSGYAYSFKSFFARNIEDILKIGVDKNRTAQPVCEELSAPQHTERKTVRVALVNESESNDKGIMKYLCSLAENKKIQMSRVSSNGDVIYRASNVRSDAYPSVEFIIEFTLIPSRDLREKPNSNLERARLFNQSHYDVLAFDRSKYSNKGYLRLKKKLKEINGIFENSGYARPKILVLDKNNQSMYEDICSATQSVAR